MPTNEQIEAARDAGAKEFIALGDTAATMTAACHALALLLIQFPAVHRQAALDMSLRQVREAVDTFKGGE
jgi:hypothetical protein